MKRPKSMAPNETPENYNTKWNARNLWQQMKRPKTMAPNETPENYGTKWNARNLWHQMKRPKSMVSNETPEIYGIKWNSFSVSQKTLTSVLNIIITAAWTNRKYQKTFDRGQRKNTHISYLEKAVVFV